MTTDSWWTGSEASSFAAAPIEWKEGQISESFYNMTGHPICMHVKTDGHEYFTKINEDSMLSPQANFSASFAYWHLIHTGSKVDELWTQLK